MRRRVLALLVLVLVTVAMMAFAGLAFAQPAGCKGIGKGVEASKNKQGPPHNPKANPKAHCATAFGGCEDPLCF